jgi:hypothetical protein
MEYRRDKRFFGTRTRATGGGGGGISLLVLIVFCLKIANDGNWNSPFADWSFNYLVYSYLWAFILVVLIFGIPIGIGVILWMRYEMEKKPPAPTTWRPQ